MKSESIKIVNAMHRRICCVCGLSIDPKSNHKREFTDTYFKWRDYHIDCNPVGDVGFDADILDWKHFIGKKLIAEEEVEV